MDFGSGSSLNIPFRQLLQLSFAHRIKLLATLFFNKRLDIYEKLLHYEQLWPEMQSHTYFEEQLQLFLDDSNVRSIFNNDANLRKVINGLIARMMELKGFRKLRSNYTLIDFYNHHTVPSVDRDTPILVAFLESEYLRFRVGIKIWLHLGENPRFRSARHLGRRRVLFDPRLFHLHRDITRQMYKHQHVCGCSKYYLNCELYCNTVLGRPVRRNRRRII